MKHLKITSVLLSITMCASMVMTPVSVIADESEATSETQTELTEKEEPEAKETQAPKETEKQEAEAPEESEKEPETKESEQDGETEPAKPEEETKDDKKAAETEEKIPSGTASVSKKAAVIGSGSCGSGLTWSLTDAGTLTISKSGSGTGVMDNWGGGEAPWCSSANRDKITKVVINKGVTSIGEYAFGCLNGLTSVSIPQTVKTIEFAAFTDSRALKSIQDWYR